MAIISHSRTTETQFSDWAAPGTTVPLTTSYTSSEVQTGGYGFGLFHTLVTSNVGWEHPPCYLQQRYNADAAWVTFATIHPDFTTTGNEWIEEVFFHGDYLRVMIPPTATTTVMCSFTVLAKLKGTE